MQNTLQESQKKLAIEEAALELFTRQGFGSTPVPSIAERAKVGSGTIYRYFESKEELVNYIFQHWQEQLHQVLTENYSEHAGSRQKFNELWNRLAFFQSKHPVAFDFLEMMYYTPHLNKESKNRRVRLLKFLTQLLHEGKDDFRALSPDALIAIVWGAFVGLVRASTTGRIKLDESLLAQSREAIWQAIAK